MNLTCRKVTEILVDYVDGSLPEHDRDTLQRHLCGCVPCAIYLRTYHDTIILTKSLPDVPLPAELMSRLKAMIEKECGRSQD